MSDDEDMDEEDLEEFKRLLPASRTNVRRSWSSISLVAILLVNTVVVALVLHSGIFFTPTLVRWSDLRPSAIDQNNKTFPFGSLSWAQSFTPSPCGSTPTEALSRGCHFDLVATAWLPPRCIDYDLVDEFEALYPWKFYTSPAQNETYPANDHDWLGSLNATLWTTNRWHMAHCLFMWKKLSRAMLQGRDTDAEAVKQGHVDHCTSTILDQDTVERLDVVAGIVEIIYPPC